MEIPVNNGKEERPVFMLGQIFETYRKRGLLTNGDSTKLLKLLMEKKILSPGQAIFYGLCLDPDILRKMSEDAKELLDGRKD